MTKEAQRDFKAPSVNLSLDMASLRAMMDMITFSTGQGCVKIPEISVSWKSGTALISLGNVPLIKVTISDEPST